MYFIREMTDPVRQNILSLLLFNIKTPMNTISVAANIYKLLATETELMFLLTLLLEHFYSYYFENIFAFGKITTTSIVTY